MTTIESLKVLRGRTEFLALCERASYEFRRQNYAVAVELFRDAVSIAPSDPVGHKGLGAACAFAGLYSESIDHFLLVKTLRPGDPSGYINAGGLLNIARRFDEAIDVLRTGLRRVGDHADIYFNLGIAYRHQDQPRMAISCYRESLNLRPRQPDAYLNLGNIYVRRGELHQALDQYSRALLINPDFQQAQIGRMHVNALLLGEAGTGMPESANGIPIAPPPPRTSVVNGSRRSFGHSHDQSSGASVPKRTIDESTQRAAAICDHLLTALQHRVHPVVSLLSRLVEDSDQDAPLVESVGGQLREELARLTSLMERFSGERQSLETLCRPADRSSFRVHGSSEHLRRSAIAR